MRKTTLIKSYAYFKGQLEWAYKNNNEKLINYYTNEIQKILTRYYTGAENTDKETKEHN